MNDTIQLNALKVALIFALTALIVLVMTILYQEGRRDVFSDCAYLGSARIYDKVITCTITQEGKTHK